jgi:hypothetical protein
MNLLLAHIPSVQVTDIHIEGIHIQVTGIWGLTISRNKYQTRDNYLIKDNYPAWNNALTRDIAMTRDKAMIRAVHDVVVWVA